MNLMPATLQSLFAQLSQPSSRPLTPAISGLREYSRDLVLELWRGGDFANLGFVVQKKAQWIISRKLAKKNKSGEFYMPRFEKVRVNDTPEHHFVQLQLDAEAFHHFDKDDFADQSVLDALAANLRFFVYVRPWNPVGGGLTYVMLLDDRLSLPTAPPKAVPAPAARLPKVVAYDPGMFEGGALSLDKLMLLVGVDTQGPKTVPFEDFGHALIAGNTKSGKSNEEHVLLASLLAHTSPRDLRIVLIDPKNGILAPWSRMPHLWRWDGDKPAYTSDPEEAGQLMEAVVAEMNRRGKLRNPNPGDPNRPIFQRMSAYNRTVSTQERVPFLLVIIDEFMDLDKVASVMSGMRTIVQRGYADHVILWAATQNVTAKEGFPAFIRQQMSTYVIFRLTSLEQSRMLGCPDAHRISQETPGRFYVRGLGKSREPELMQSYFIEDQVDDLARRMSGTGQVSHTLPDTLKKFLEYAYANHDGKATGEIFNAWCKQEGRGDSGHGREGLLQSLEEEGWLVRNRQAGNGRRLSEKALTLFKSVEPVSEG